jgi:CNT family concentrative nucleoside transporter
MAGIAGTMMVIYAAILGPVIPDSLGHILIASIISTPAALAVAALMVPFTPEPNEAAALSEADRPSSAMEAIVRGTIDGIGIVATIIAMLIVLVALVTLVNLALGHLPLDGDPLTLQQIFAYARQPWIGVMTTIVSGAYLFMAPVAASTPSPITPPAMMLPAAIPSLNEVTMPAPS